MLTAVSPLSWRACMLLCKVLSSISCCYDFCCNHHMWIGELRYIIKAYHFHALCIACLSLLKVSVYWILSFLLILNYDVDECRIHG